MLPSFALKVAREIKELRIQSATTIAKEGLKVIFRIWDEAQDEKEALAQIYNFISLVLTYRPNEPLFLNYSLKALEQIRERKYEEFIEEMEEEQRKIAEYGSELIHGTVLTHCHSTTVVRTLMKAKEKGKDFQVINTETRPKFQGRKTAKKLLEAGIKVKHVVDSCVAHVMPSVSMVLVGGDVVTAKGELVNKVGTLTIAMVAREHGVPLYSALSTSKFDFLTLYGKEEVIEQRDPDEIWENAPEGLEIFNPAFDLVPAKYIRAFITERGIKRPRELVKEAKANVRKRVLTKVYCEEHFLPYLRDLELEGFDVEVGVGYGINVLRSRDRRASGIVVGNFKGAHAHFESEEQLKTLVRILSFGAGYG